MLRIFNRPDGTGTTSRSKVVILATAILGVLRSAGVDLGIPDEVAQPALAGLIGLAAWFIRDAIGRERQLPP